MDDGPSPMRRITLSDSYWNDKVFSDENTDSGEEIQEIRTEELSLGYKTRSIARQQAANPQSYDRDDSSVDESSSSGDGLTTTARGHLKHNIAEEVRIIDSELPKYPKIHGKYKFYSLAWISEAPEYYYPIMVREFYVNYIAIMEGLRKKEKKSTEICIDDMEARVNNRLKDLTASDLSRFAAKLKKSQEHILKLQQEQKPQEFPIPGFEELENDVTFIDLLGEQPKAVGKCP
ncbi:hypothetical protein HAX54_049535 [Datura stramonium]|uniref:Uncharacterized protein n=1 Tax=Datura stramonium TaxID=4076 RepID=A0ABS8WKI0_DATST|nr:hypothetical protein [Datura stramonium]